MQKDLLCPTQTPREALLFSAKLRMPSSVKASEKRELVDKMLVDLGLVKCADTFIGNEMLRGISGGEKKRTSVGIELIMKPKIVFLDEPTSGLDSYAAHSVINKLRELATSADCNILCTIHQPSSEVFHLFNKVMLLREGRRFFCGTIQALSQQLTALDHGCPGEYNLSDHVMFMLQTTPEDELMDLQKKLTDEKLPQPSDTNVTRVSSGGGDRDRDRWFLDAAQGTRQARGPRNLAEQGGLDCVARSPPRLEWALRAHLFSGWRHDVARL